MTSTRDQLHQIADWLPHLSAMLTSSPPLTVLSSERTPPNEPPAPDGSGAYPSMTGPGLAPVRLSVVDLQQDMHGTLSGRVRVAIEDGITDDDWPSDTLLGLTWWLIRNADAMEHHEAGQGFADEIDVIWRRVRAAVGERPPRRPRCTRIVDGQACGARVDGHDEDGQRTGIIEHWRWCSCPACGETYTFDAALQRLGQLQTMTLQQWADEYGVDRGVLKMRLHRLGLRADGDGGRYTRALMDLHRDALTSPVVARVV